MAEPPNSNKRPYSRYPWLLESLKRHQPGPSSAAQPTTKSAPAGNASTENAPGPGNQASPGHIDHQWENSARAGQAQLPQQQQVATAPNTNGWAGQSIAARPHLGQQGQYSVGHAGHPLAPHHVPSMPAAAAANAPHSNTPHAAMRTHHHARSAPAAGSNSHGIHVPTPYNPAPVYQPGQSAPHTAPTSGTPQQRQQQQQQQQHAARAAQYPAQYPAAQLRTGQAAQQHASVPQQGMPPAVHSTLYQQQRAPACGAAPAHWGDTRSGPGSGPGQAHTSHAAAAPAYSTAALSATAAAASAHQQQQQQHTGTASMTHAPPQQQNGAAPPLQQPWAATTHSVNPGVNPGASTPQHGGQTPQNGGQPYALAGSSRQQGMGAPPATGQGQQPLQQRQGHFPPGAAPFPAQPWPGAAAMQAPHATHYLQAYHNPGSAAPVQSHPYTTHYVQHAPGNAAPRPFQPTMSMPTGTAMSMPTGISMSMPTDTAQQHGAQLPCMQLAPRPFSNTAPHSLQQQPAPHPQFRPPPATSQGPAHPYVPMQTSRPVYEQRHGALGQAPPPAAAHTMHAMQRPALAPQHQQQQHQHQQQHQQQHERQYERQQQQHERQQYDRQQVPPAQQQKQQQQQPPHERQQYDRQQAQPAQQQQPQQQPQQQQHSHGVRAQQWPAHASSEQPAAGAQHNAQHAQRAQQQHRVADAEDDTPEFQGAPARSGAACTLAGSVLAQSMPGSAAQNTGPLYTATLGVGTRGRLTLSFSGRHDALFAHVRKMLPDLQKGDTLTSFVFPGRYLPQVVQVCEGRLPGVTMKVVPLHVTPASLLRAGAQVRDQSHRLDRLPPALRTKMMPFQLEGVQFALQRGGRVLIGDEMGLGKTVQALAVAHCFADEWPLLVITPSSLRENWAEALHQWLRLSDADVHLCWKDSDAAAPWRKKVVIVSYDLMRTQRVQEACTALAPGVVICDESHFIKSPNAQRTKAVLATLKKARRVMLLSGTPALSKPAELYTQLSSLLPGAKLTLNAFGERYCKGTAFDKLAGCQNEGELNMILVNTVMIRRLKDDVLKQLPAKRRNKVVMRLPAGSKEAKELEQLKAKQGAVKAALQAAGGFGAAKAVAATAAQESRSLLSEMFRKTAELKVQLVAEHLVTVLQSTNRKIITFAHHKVLLDAMEKAVSGLKPSVGYIRIDGTTPAYKRQGFVNEFQSDEKCRVAILSLKAAGTGLTFTAASHVIFAEMYWVPGELMQAEDRSHRIGQSSCVDCVYLLLRDSVDDVMWDILSQKTKTVGEMLNGVQGKIAVASSIINGQTAVNNMMKRCEATKEPAPPPAARTTAGAQVVEIIDDDDDDDFEVPRNRHGQPTVSAMFAAAGKQCARDEEPL